MAKSDVSGRHRSCIFLWPLVVTLGLSITSGCRQGTPQAERKKPTVVVTPATTLDVPLIESSNSTTSAVNAVTISARVKGFLTEIHFTEGSDVKKDDLLFVIDKKPYEVSVQLAEAKLAESKAGLDKAERSKGVEVAKAQLALSKAGEFLQTVQDQRARMLFDRNAASQGDKDLAKAQLEKAVAQVQADTASLAQAQSDFLVDQEAAKAQVAQAQAQVEQAKIDLGYCTMKAPLAGRIGAALIKKDNLVGNVGGETALAIIQQLDPIQVDMYISSRYLPEATKLVAQGLKIEIDLGEKRPQRYEGVVDFIDNTVGKTTGTLLLKAKVANPDKTILPGEYARWYATVEVRKNAIVVPEKAVVQTQAGPTVYVVNDGKVGVAPVVVADDTYKGIRVVTSGLTAGQMVIVEGIQLVRPDALVETKEVPLQLLDDTAPTPAKPAGR